MQCYHTPMYYNITLYSIIVMVSYTHVLQPYTILLNCINTLQWCINNIHNYILVYHIITLMYHNHTSIEFLTISEGYRGIDGRGWVRGERAS